MKKFTHDERARAMADGVLDPRAAAVREVGRRDFVRTTSGLFVAAAFGLGCKDALPGTLFGRITVRITGLSAGVASAGSATVTGAALEAPLNIILPAQTVGELEVPVGTYTVTYAAPSGYAIADGEFNTESVEVVAGELTSVGFTVEPAAATLRIVATGLGAGVGGGGDAQVTRTDIAGQSPVNVILPPAGQLDTGLTPGIYSVRYTPPTGYELTAGQENPRQISVAGGATTSTSFTVQVVAGPPPSGVLFSSDWRTALGTSVNAQRDGIVGGSPAPRWSFMGGSSACEVVSAAGLDLPTTNCLRVPFSPAAFNFLRVDTLPQIAVGTRRCFRFYIRVTMPTADSRITDWNFHPIQDGGAGSQCNWVFQTYCNYGTQWQPQVWSGAPTQPFPYNNWVGPLLNKNTTYRFEIQMYRNTATTFQLSVRVFNSANTQILGNADFSNGVSHTLATIPGNVPGTTDFIFNNVANTNGLNAGTNDTYTLSPASPPVTFGYEAAFAVADNTADGWIGPYAGGI
jgi:hypothetical protein